jgi:sulfide:quinone oxidoreductase
LSTKSYGNKMFAWMSAATYWSDASKCAWSNTPIGRLGSVAHFQAEVIAVSIIARCRGVKPELESDGHANCFIETGYGKAILVDFNYDIQPAPGKFPLPVIGPMSLLKETRLNHTGKLMFKYVYQMLLRGMPIPLVGSRMTTRGKDLSVLEKYAWVVLR